MSPDKKSDLNMQYNFEWLLGFTDNKGKKTNSRGNIRYRKREAGKV